MSGFKPSGFNLSIWAVKHRAIVIFLMLASLFGGLYSFTHLGRQEDPNFNPVIMTAVVAWPGATTQDVQDQVLNRLEQAMQELTGVDAVRSFARQGYGGLTLVMKGGMSGKQLEESWYQARKKINDIRHQLPAGVQGPFFNDEYADVYTALFALQAPELSVQELNDYSSQLKKQLQSVAQVGAVDIFGKQAEQVEVAFSSRRLAALGLTPQQIFAALSQQNQLTPSGSVDTDSDRVFVRVDGSLRTVEDVANVSVSAGGRLLKLSDIAEISYKTADPADFKIRYQGAPTVVIGITLQKHGDILALGQALEQRMTQVKAELPLGVTLTQIADQSTVVKQSVWEFEKVFLEALAIVLLVCFVALGWRTGLIVAASVPLVLGLVAMVMYSVGWQLDRISLGALIIALGLLVDDAIIAVEMMVVKLEEGWDQVSAAGYAYTSTAFPMLTGTMITVAGFLPVGFAKSTSGEYAGGIFWVVGTALVVSWLVAVIFIPYLGTLMLPKNLAAASDDHTKNGHAKQHDPYDRPLYRRFRGLVAWAIRFRVVVLAATVGLFVLAIVGMGLVQQQFFPTASRPELLVELRMKEGTAFAATEAEVKRLEQLLKQDADVKYFTSYIGQSSPRFFLSLSPELPNPNYAQIVVMTDSMVEREAVRGRLMRIFDDNLQFPAVRGRVSRLEFGPPVGFPVQFRVMGPDVDQIRLIAEQVRAELHQSPLLRDTQLEWNEQVRSLNIRIDQDKVRLLGLSSTDVANTVQAVLSGAPVSQIRRGEELVSVVVRATPDERQQLDQLDGINLFSASGAVVPLSQVATIEPSFEEPVLWRRNRDVVLTVRADVVDGVQGPYASQQVLPTLQPIIDRLPVGYRIEMGGAIEESNKANVAIAQVFPVMLLVMLFFLMLQVQSFARMGLVLLTAPLGIIGVVPALLLFNAPFGFVALLGVIALSGMIMRNSVILVVQIDQEISEGRTPWDAVIEATVRRARPVILTAAAAVLAMVPLSSSVFWGPMAIAIMGGLLVATGLTLLFVPALYALWFRVKPPTSATIAATEQPT